VTTRENIGVIGTKPESKTGLGRLDNEKEIHIRCVETGNQQKASEEDTKLHAVFQGTKRAVLASGATRSTAGRTRLMM